MTSGITIEQFEFNLGMINKVAKKVSKEKNSKGAHQGWRTIGGKEKYYRSIWEANYARYLQFQKENGLIADWLHEPTTFWFEDIKRGCRSYLPDFKVILDDGSHHWIEVKGFMDAKSKTKLKRLEKYYPNEKISVVDSKWFSTNAKKIRGLIKDWEYAKPHNKITKL